jgi:hypothetical protein
LFLSLESLKYGAIFIHIHSSHQNIKKTISKLIRWLWSH